MLDGILEDVKMVDIVEVHLGLGPNALTSEVAIRIGKLVPKVRHMSVGVPSRVVIIEATRVPWGIRRHDHVGKQVEFVIRVGTHLQTWKTIGV